MCSAQARQRNINHSIPVLPPTQSVLHRCCTLCYRMQEPNEGADVDFCRKVTKAINTPMGEQQQQQRIPATEAAAVNTRQQHLQQQCGRCCQSISNQGLLTSAAESRWWQQQQQGSNIQAVASEHTVTRGCFSSGKSGSRQQLDKQCSFRRSACNGQWQCMQRCTTYLIAAAAPHFVAVLVWCAAVAVFRC